jgi:hypothetical protein
MSVARMMQQAAAGVSAGGGSMFGPSYSNWDGSYINFDTTSNANSGTSSNLNGTQHFYDPVTNRVYDGYNGNVAMTYHTGSPMLWNAGTSQMPNRPTTVYITGATMVYQNNTSYVLFGLYIGNSIYVYENATTPIYKGYFSITGGLGSAWQPRGLCFAEWNGDPVLWVTNNSTNLNRYTLPDLENLSGATITLDGYVRVSSGSGNPNYNIHYGGKDSSGYQYFYYRMNGGFKQEKVLDNAADNTQCTNVNIATASGSYGIYIDYGNENLYTGGLANQVLYRYPAI